MNIKVMARAWINRLARWIGAENMLKLEARLRFGKKMDLDDPKTLSDKICYLEFRTVNPLTSLCSDKYEVREYVASKGLGSLLVPLIGDVYNSVEEIDFDALPEQFALKATNGCKMNIICGDKTALDVEATKKQVGKWFADGFNRDVLEPHYKNIKMRVICEQFLEDAETIVDYKFHCLNGEPRFVLVCSERSHSVKKNLYDTNWAPIHEVKGKSLNDKEMPKPQNLQQMLQISRKLSEDFCFVRVDLYEIKGKVYFGELSFTPDGGFLSNFTNRFDREMGALLKLPEKGTSKN